MRDLLKWLKEQVTKETAQTLQVIRGLRLVEERKLYAELGYPSLFEFAVKYLGYSEGAAYRRVSAMRLIKENPEAEEKISSGKLSLTNAAKAQTLIKKGHNAKEVLSHAEGKSSREAFPEDKWQRKIGIDKELSDLLDQVRDEFSHVKPGMSDLELLKHMAKKCLNANDFASEVVPRQRSEASARKSETRRVPTGMKNIVWKRDQGRCTYTGPDGHRCGSTHLLEYDHIKPWALGGETTIDNLRLLCRTHNLHVARRVFM